MKNKMEKTQVGSAIKKLITMSKEESRDVSDVSKKGTDLVSIAKKLSSKKFSSKK